MKTAAHDDPEFPSPHVVLFTRDGCHLCDDALEVLRRHGIEPECVDIDANSELRDLYDEKIPVVVVNGEPRFFGRVDPILLRRLLPPR